MSDTNVRLRYAGPAARFRFPEADIDVARGETVTVDPEQTLQIVPDDEDDEPTTVALDAYLVDLGLERVDRGYRALLDEPIAEIEAALATGEHDGHLEALAHAEREGQNRTGALEAIHDRQEELE
jgi:hypothetical protein